MISLGTIVTLAAFVFEVILSAAGDCSHCGKYQYCRSGDNGCGDCTDICESKKPDYNWELCQKDCYDYLRDHTLHYGSIMEHKDTIEKIYSLVIVIIILLVTLLAMVGGVLSFKVYRYYIARRLKKLERKKYKEKLSAVQYSISNNNTIRERETNGQALSNMRNTMPSTITLTTQPESSPTYTNTSATRTLPLSSEEPSEDTTLDYASYVNQGMSHSQSKETDLNTTPKYRY